MSLTVTETLTNASAREPLLNNLSDTVTKKSRPFLRMPSEKNRKKSSQSLDAIKVKGPGHTLCSDTESDLSPVSCTVAEFPITRVPKTNTIRVYTPNLKPYDVPCEDLAKVTVKEVLEKTLRQSTGASGVFHGMFDLYFMSPLLSVPLKPNYVLWDVYNSWPGLVQKFTEASPEDRIDDLPTLILRRSIYFTPEAEKKFDEQCRGKPLEQPAKRAIDMLYADALDSYMSGKYVVKCEDIMQLAAYQLVIDKDIPKDAKKLTTFVHDNLQDVVPECCINKMQCIMFFGIEKMRFWKSHEDKILGLVEKCKAKDKTELQMNYIAILRQTPYYGAAFFDGRIEKNQIPQALKNLNLPKLQDLTEIQVRVSVRSDVVTVVEKTKKELLVQIALSNCEWHQVNPAPEDAAGVPSLVLHFFKDPREQGPNTPSFALPIFTKQAPLAVKCLKAFRNSPPTTPTSNFVSPSVVKLCSAYLDEKQKVMTAQSFLKKIQPLN